MRRKRFHASALLLLAFAALAACDKGTPVAPSGATLTVTASPSQIGASGTSTITVLALRPNGQPVNHGTEIRFTTTLGSIQEIATTDQSGVARAVLHAEGRTGTAKVTASSGAVDAATVDVTIGFKAGTITLQSSPNAVGSAGGTIALVASLRDDQGQPLAGADVTFDSPVGSLASGGAPVATDANGEAHDTLTVTADDLARLSADSFDVKAQSTAGGGSVSDTSTIAVRRPPEASFTFTKAGLQVIFSDASTGAPTSWKWNFGDGTTSTAKNPTHTFPAAGTFVVTLTVTNSEGTSSESQFVSVS